MNKLKQLEKYKIYLYEEEKSSNTIQKYLRDINKFFDFIGKEKISKQKILEFKEWLVTKYEPSSVNSILAAINNYLDWIGEGNLKVKPLKIQKVIFRNENKDLTKKEFQRLNDVARQNGDEKLSLILQTICCTGIRVSELQYITVESITLGRGVVNCKGKTRCILIPKNLKQVLKRYCLKNKIKRGSIFITKTGKCMDRSNIWKKMKKLCKEAGVLESKVFPHNLRHLFAKLYYSVNKDISKLADLLGHSSINTTRIYTMESGINHLKDLEKMRVLPLKI